MAPTTLTVYVDTTCVQVPYFNSCSSLPAAEAQGLAMMTATARVTARKVLATVLPSLMGRVQATSSRAASRNPPDLNPTTVLDIVAIPQIATSPILGTGSMALVPLAERDMATRAQAIQVVIIPMAVIRMLAITRIRTLDAPSMVPVLLGVLGLGTRVRIAMTMTSTKVVY